MSVIVNMVRGSAAIGGRDRFSCSAAAWDQLLDIGKAFGWKPLGTGYVPRDATDLTETAVRHGYRPGDAKDYKLVDADDAFAWARALTEAKQSPHLAAMLNDLPSTTNKNLSSDELQSANAPFAIVMDEFIEYAFGGEFSFARAE